MFIVTGLTIYSTYDKMEAHVYRKCLEIYQKYTQS